MSATTYRFVVLVRTFDERRADCRAAVRFERALAAILDGCDAIVEHTAFVPAAVAPWNSLACDCCNQREALQVCAQCLQRHGPCECG